MNYVTQSNCGTNTKALPDSWCAGRAVRGVKVALCGGAASPGVEVSPAGQVAAHQEEWASEATNPIANTTIILQGLIGDQSTVPISGIYVWLDYVTWRVE